MLKLRETERRRRSQKYSRELHVCDDVRMTLDRDFWANSDTKAATTQTDRRTKKSSIELLSKIKGFYSADTLQTILYLLNKRNRQKVD